MRHFRNTINISKIITYVVLGIISTLLAIWANTHEEAFAQFIFGFCVFVSIVLIGLEASNPTGPRKHI